MLCGTPSYFPPLLQMQVVFMIFFISSSGDIYAAHALTAQLN